jgi:uncharacterized membrane protein YfcA
MTLVVILALIIGLLLGLLGGGGSVLTVPVMVYVVGLEPKSAIATSLIVVGTTSLVAVIGHWRAGRVCWKNALAFGLAGMTGAYGGGRVAAFIPGNILLILFAAVMLATAIAMLRGRKERAVPRSGSLCPARVNVPAVVFDGFLVGAINGLVGVGGGFVIVPALNLLGGLPMHAAIGTSLLVISMNSAAALAGYISHVGIDWHLVAIFTGAAVAGSLIGGLLSKRVSGTALRRVFGVFVMGVAGYLFYRELNWEVLAEVQELLLEHRDFVLGVLTATLVPALFWLRSLLQDQGRSHRSML